jgi:hypothetical protein
MNFKVSNPSLGQSLAIIYTLFRKKSKKQQQILKRSIKTDALSTDGDLHVYVEKLSLSHRS